MRKLTYELSKNNKVIVSTTNKFIFANKVINMVQKITGEKMSMDQATLYLVEEQGYDYIVD